MLPDIETCPNPPHTKPSLEIYPQRVALQSLYSQCFPAVVLRLAGTAAMAGPCDNIVALVLVEVMQSTLLDKQLTVGQSFFNYLQTSMKMKWKN